MAGHTENEPASVTEVGSVNMVATSVGLVNGSVRMVAKWNGNGNDYGSWAEDACVSVGECRAVNADANRNYGEIAVLYASKISAGSCQYN